MYYIEKFARDGKLKVYYGWLAYSFRPILFFCALGLLIIFIGTDWKSPFWELIAGLALILIGIVLSVRSLRKRKDIKDKFRAGEIEPGGEG